MDGWCAGDGGVGMRAAGDGVSAEGPAASSAGGGGATRGEILAFIVGVAGVAVAECVALGLGAPEIELRYVELLVGLMLAFAMGGGFVAVGLLRALGRWAGHGASGAAVPWYRWRVLGYDVVDAVVGCVGFGVGSWICWLVLDGWDFEALRGQGFLVGALRAGAGFALGGCLIWLGRWWGWDLYFILFRKRD